MEEASPRDEIRTKDKDTNRDEEDSNPVEDTEESPTEGSLIKAPQKGIPG